MTYKKHPPYQATPNPKEEKYNFRHELKNYTKWKNDFSDEMEVKTLKYQRKYGFDTASPDGSPTHNNEADAFKHTFMSAMMSLIAFEGASKYKGDEHEINGLKKDNPINESRMDLWNNRQGREIAKEVENQLKKGGYSKNDVPYEKLEDWVAESVMQKMLKGELITNPNDTRETSDFQKILKN